MARHAQGNRHRCKDCNHPWGPRRTNMRKTRSCSHFCHTTITDDAPVVDNDSEG